MPAPRTARIEIRASPEEKDQVEAAAAAAGVSVSAFLLDAALRRVPSGRSRLGAMRGTARIAGDIVGHTDPEGWEPGEFPS